MIYYLDVIIQIIKSKITKKINDILKLYKVFLSFFYYILFIYKITSQLH